MSRLPPIVACATPGGDAMTARVIGWIEDAGRVAVDIAAQARLGAASENDVVVPAAGVSTHHARIVKENGDYWLEDAGSGDGTWLNGERITRARLRHLDVLTLGTAAELVFLQRADAPAPAPLATETGGPRTMYGVPLPKSMPVFERTMPPADQTIIGPLPTLPPNLSAARARSQIASVRLVGKGVFTILPGTATVGRSADATVRIDSREISRLHATVTVTDAEVAVEDKGSVNGTTVNGTAVKSRQTLMNGDRVAFADVEFRVEIERTNE